MKCPKCQTENPETRKFCRQCGAGLILVCPQCSWENLPGDKFGGECGYKLDFPLFKSRFNEWGHQYLYKHHHQFCLCKTENHIANLK